MIHMQLETTYISNQIKSALLRTNAAPGMRIEDFGNICPRAIWYAGNSPESKKIPDDKYLHLELNTVLKNALAEKIPDNPFAVVIIKPLNNSNFNNFKKKGLYLWSEEAFNEIQLCMGVLGKKHGFFLAVNRDTYKLHDEYITFNEHLFTTLMERGKEIINSETPPERINDSPSFYKCKKCFYKKTCHNLNS